MAGPKLRPEPVPLAKDGDGAIRVGGTRVTLDTIVEAFREGATPEEILQQYPALQLADVYAAISYYLRHQGEVEGYLQVREEQAMGIRVENERRSPSVGLRERLLNRRARRR